MSFLKGCILFSFNLHLEKCVRQTSFLSTKNFYWGKLFTGESDEISRKIRHFSPIRCLIFDFSPVSQIQTINFYFGVSFDFKPSTLSAISENFQKTFRFITATDFWASTLMKLNSTMMFFLGVLQIELEHYFT